MNIYRVTINGNIVYEAVAKDKSEAIKQVKKQFRLFHKSNGKEKYEANLVNDEL